MRIAYVFGLLVLAVVGGALFGLLDDDETGRRTLAAETHPTLPPPTPTTSEPPTTTVPSGIARVPDQSPTGVTVRDLVGTTTTTEPPLESAAQPPSTEPPPPTNQPPASAATTTTVPPPPPPPEVQGGPNTEFESQFASSINSNRSGNGLAPLSRDGSLDSRARSWSEAMANAGGLSHSDLGSLLPPWSAAAENVGVGGSVSAVFEALVGSSGHQANMLGDYTHYGVGAWVDSSGTIWTTHVFTR
ncbi:MAG: CAP domain-containing protein [Acidimicrobiia bacterium]